MPLSSSVSPRVSIPARGVRAEAYPCSEHQDDPAVVPPPGKSMQEALRFGCQVAGKKCGLQGFDGIV